jgi:hypothetical protein
MNYALDLNFNWVNLKFKNMSCKLLEYI